MRITDKDLTELGFTLTTVTPAESGQILPFYYWTHDIYGLISDSSDEVDIVMGIEIFPQYSAYEFRIRDLNLLKEYINLMQRIKENEND